MTTSVLPFWRRSPTPAGECACRARTPVGGATVIVVVSGPGGVGKGTVVSRVVEADDKMVLSRSWTTRRPRPTEGPDAYVFVDRPAFEAHIAAGGFLEYAEFLGDLYGTPMPDIDPHDTDLLLEIDVQGAAQVARRFPSALLILLVAPSREVQRQRLEARGDTPGHVERRLAAAAGEEAEARRLGAVVVVNDVLDDTVAEVLALVDAARNQL